MSSIKRIKVGDITYDLGNRALELSTLTGTLTEDQLNLLLSSESNYIKYSDGRVFRLVSTANSKLYYQRITATDNKNQFFVVDTTDRTYELTENILATQSWTNTQIQTAIGDAIAASY